MSRYTETVRRFQMGRKERLTDGWVAICYQANNGQVLFSTQELVMCRSCKWGTVQKNGKLNNIKCEILETLMKEKDYCSYGESKELRNE